MISKIFSFFPKYFHQGIENIFSKLWKYGIDDEYNETTAMNGYVFGVTELPMSDGNRRCSVRLYDTPDEMR